MTTSPGSGPEARPREVAPVAWLPVAGIAAAAFVLLMLVAGRYGYHRDELYFVAASHHLAWGYVDQPPLSVALVWLARRLFGDSLVGLRLFPALAFAAAVDSSGLQQWFTSVERFARIGNAAGVDNEENGQSIWLCRGRARPWAEIWPDFQHYD